MTWLIDYGYIIQEFCGRARSLHMHWGQLVHFQAPNVTCWWFGVQHKVFWIYWLSIEPPWDLHRDQRPSRDLRKEAQMAQIGRLLPEAEQEPEVEVGPE